MQCVPLLVQFVGKQLPYDNITQLRERMADVAPHLVKNDTVESPMWLNGEYFKVQYTCALLQPLAIYIFMVPEHLQQ